MNARDLFDAFQRTDNRFREEAADRIVPEAQKEEIMNRKWIYGLTVAAVLAITVGIAGFASSLNRPGTDEQSMTAASPSSVAAETAEDSGSTANTELSDTAEIRTETDSETAAGTETIPLPDGLVIETAPEDREEPDPFPVPYGTPRELNLDQPEQMQLWEALDLNNPTGDERYEKNLTVQKGNYERTYRQITEANPAELKAGEPAEWLLRLNMTEDRETGTTSTPVRIVLMQDGDFLQVSDSPYHQLKNSLDANPLNVSSMPQTVQLYFIPVSDSPVTVFLTAFPDYYRNSGELFHGYWPMNTAQISANVRETDAGTAPHAIQAPEDAYTPYPIDHEPALDPQGNAILNNYTYGAAIGDKMDYKAQKEQRYSIVDKQHGQKEFSRDEVYLKVCLPGDLRVSLLCDGKPFIFDNGGAENQASLRFDCQNCNRTLNYRLNTEGVESGAHEFTILINDGTTSELSVYHSVVILAD